MSTSSGEYFLFGLILLVLLLLFYKARRKRSGDGVADLDIHEVARILVQAAEQMMPEASGNQKLTFVMNKLNALFSHIDPMLIRAVIEATVYQVKQLAKQGG